jgi:N-acetylglucosamine kinase-like BadF-type ATPase
VNGIAPLGLGLDAGGTTTRWALCTPDGTVVAEGVGGGMTGVQLLSDHGKVSLNKTLGELGSAVLSKGAARHVCGGFTGLDQHSPVLAQMIGHAFQVSADAVELKSDIEIAYHDVFSPGEGYVVYAGTGTIAAFIDEHGTMHRAGGRGVMLDDAGGGFWIAKEALRTIWRHEDERPGTWRDSPMAEAVFAHIGGADWAATRAFFYGKERGDIGQLARAVATVADRDPVAMQLLINAGHELARLARAMIARHGTKPVALCGRALLLHPVIERTIRADLPEASIQLKVVAAHHAAAHIAARKVG